jgi:hypothetical protein
LGILKGFDMLFQCEMKVNDLDGEIHDVGFKNVFRIFSRVFAGRLS